MVERNYELRKLCADDIFPMVNIISKIGIENMADCFDAKEMEDIMEADENLKIEFMNKLYGKYKDDIRVDILVENTDFGVGD